MGTPFLRVPAAFQQFVVSRVVNWTTRRLVRNLWTDKFAETLNEKLAADICSIKKTASLHIN